MCQYKSTYLCNLKIKSLFSELLILKLRPFTTNLILNSPSSFTKFSLRLTEVVIKFQDWASLVLEKEKISYIHEYTEKWI